MGEKVPLEEDDAAIRIAAARDNFAALERCPGPHAFECVNPSAAPVFRTWRCRTCGGEVTEVTRRWYERGLAHGRAESAGAEAMLAMVAAALERDWKAEELFALRDALRARKP